MTKLVIVAIFPVHLYYYYSQFSLGKNSKNQPKNENMCFLPNFANFVVAGSNP
jgi:hypothetical protein